MTLPKDHSQEVDGSQHYKPQDMAYDAEHSTQNRGCKAFSVTCGDSSPKGRAKTTAIEGMDIKMERIGIDTLH